MRVFRAYLLLNVKEEKTGQVARILRSKQGVVTVDLLDGSPNVIIMVEAPHRQRLAELTIAALTSIESMTEDLTLLPVRDECDPFIYSRHFGKGRAQKLLTCVTKGK